MRALKKQKLQIDQEIKKITDGNSTLGMYRNVVNLTIEDDDGNENDD